MRKWLPYLAPAEREVVSMHLGLDGPPMSLKEVARQTNRQLPTVATLFRRSRLRIDGAQQPAYAATKERTLLIPHREFSVTERTQMTEALAKVTKTQAKYIKDYFGLNGAIPLGLSELAAKHGVTPSSALQTLKKGVAILERQTGISLIQADAGFHKSAPKRRIYNPERSRTAEPAAAPKQPLADAVEQSSKVRDELQRLPRHLVEELVEQLPLAQRQLATMLLGFDDKGPRSIKDTATVLKVTQPETARAWAKVGANLLRDVATADRGLGI